MTYLPPNVYTQREQSGNVSPLQLRRNVVPCIIGTTDGKTNTVYNEAVTRGASGNTDALTYTNVSDITLIGDSKNVTSYIKDTDYELYESGGVSYVKWLDNPITAPTLRTPTASAGAGTLPAGTYVYTITATQTGGKETTQSAGQSITLTDSTSAVVLQWDGIDAMASGYKIYRDDQLITTISNAGTTTYTDAGDAGGAAPPGSNTTEREPTAGATYYVTYTYTSYSYLTPTLYSDLNALQTDHGIDSDIGVAGKLIMGINGKGQECPQCWVVAIDSTSVASDLVGAYESALDTLYRIDQFIAIVPLVSNEAINTKVMNHCEYMSSWRSGKERYCVLSSPQDTTYTQIISNINALNYNEYVRYIANDSVSVKVYSDTSTYSWTTYDGWVLAAVYAGMRGAVTTPIDPLTNRAVKGDVRLVDDAGVDIYSIIEKDALGAVGGVLFEYATAPLSSTALGVIRCRHDLTLAVNNAEYKHSSIWETDVYLNRAVRADLVAADIIGQPQSNDLRSYAERVILRRLAVEKAAGLISRIEDVVIDADEERPYTGWIITFNYTPRYPIDTMILKRRFSFSIDQL